MRTPPFVHCWCNAALLCNVAIKMDEQGFEIWPAIDQ